MWRDWLRVWGWLANYTSAKRREEELIRIRALLEAHERERLLAGRIQRLREENEKDIEKLGSILGLNKEEQRDLVVKAQEWYRMTPEERYKHICLKYPEYVEGRVEESGGRKVFVKIQPDGDLGITPLNES